MSSRIHQLPMGREEVVPTELSPMELLAGEALAQVGRRTSSALAPRAVPPTRPLSSSSSPPPLSPVSASRPTPTASTHARKITRYRPIRSCTECRLLKRKCDRARPICQQCIRNGRQDRCRFVESHSRHLSLPRPPQPPIPTPPPPPRCSPSPPVSTPSPAPVSASTSKSTLPIGRGSPDLVAEAGPTEALHASLARLRYQALVETLAEHQHLLLPTIDQLDEILSFYRSGVEPFLRCTMVELNGPRFERCLRWWHIHNAESSTNSETAAASVAAFDPTSFTLMIVILALSLQVAEASGRAAHLPCFCSSQNKLIRVAGDCIDALQAACPPSWATVFMAPIDLVKATVLRGRWFLNRLQLQMSRSCLASALHLACVAGLHLDGAHRSMRKEEAESRRQLWWCVMAESLAAHRLDASTMLLPPSPMSPFASSSHSNAAGIETKLPSDMSATESQMLYVHITYPESILLRRHGPIHCDPIEFGFHSTYSRWAALRVIRLRGVRQTAENVTGNHLSVAELEQRYLQLSIEFTPVQLRWTEDDEERLFKLSSFDPTDPSLDQRHFMERIALHLECNLARVELHIPSIIKAYRQDRRRSHPSECDLDSCHGRQGCRQQRRFGENANPRVEQNDHDTCCVHDNDSHDYHGSLRKSLDAAQALVTLVAGCLPAMPPPVLVEPLLHGALLAGMVLAIALQMNGGRDESKAVLVHPLLRRLLRALASRATSTTPRSVTDYTAKIHHFLVSISQHWHTSSLPTSHPGVFASTQGDAVAATATATTPDPSGLHSWTVFDMSSNAPFAAGLPLQQFIQGNESDDDSHSTDPWTLWQVMCAGQMPQF